MDTEAWIAFIAVILSVFGSSAVLLVRLGQILTRIDGHHEDLTEHGRVLQNHENRITRIEVRTNP